jgi:DNA-binding NarL/FixJ family response regulator
MPSRDSALAEVPGGVEAREHIHQQPALVLLTEHLSTALAAGAGVYVLQPVRDARFNGTPPPSSSPLAARVAGSPEASAPLHSVLDPAAAAGLTPREREVLMLVADGLPDKVIAQHLVVTAQTVRNHVSHILRKLGVSNRTAAAAEARRRGIIR